MLIKQRRIYRQDLKNNPRLHYLFGDNVARMGLGGQAAEMRGEPNAIGIATKKTPSMHYEAFFTDKELEENIGILIKDIRPAFDIVAKGGIVVLPSDGLGTGLSRLEQHAPKTNQVLLELLKRLENMANGRINPYVVLPDLCYDAAYVDGILRRASLCTDLY